jgi:hypothetical protein
MESSQRFACEPELVSLLKAHVDVPCSDYTALSSVEFAYISGARTSLPAGFLLLVVVVVFIRDPICLGPPATESHYDLPRPYSNRAL